MWIAIVPAYNEALAIGEIVNKSFQVQMDLVLLVANGCTDQTCAQALHASNHRPLKILHFAQPLGVDVPKAIGAYYALRYQPEGILFVDGDMNGPLKPVLADLRSSIEGGLDLALTNCYPVCQQRSELATQVLLARKELNVHLGLYEKLGVSTPSHGPHGVSGKLLQRLNPRYIAVPPKIMVQAYLLAAEIGVGATIPHNLLGSAERTPLHAEKIAQTIIGDCKEALRLLDPTIECSTNNEGYRSQRRMDILETFLNIHSLA